MKKIAIVHDWFTSLGGSEKVIEQLVKIFPDAQLFSLVDFLPEKDRNMLDGKHVATTFLQQFPFINRNNYRNFLPLMPMAIEQLDFSDFDVIFSNCHAVSKSVITNHDQLHISYIHTPMRYAWDMQNDYLKNSGFSPIKSILARIMLHYIRTWDAVAASRPDVLIANSGFIAKRIKKIYRRKSRVIYPPVDTDYFTPEGSREDFYFTASRFVPYKRIDIIVDAFRKMPDKKLVVIGDGPELSRIRPYFSENIQWLGYQPGHVLRDYYRKCKAFIFAAKEDFGIVPLEAQACGAPVIAFGQGGALETVRGIDKDNPTGVFFTAQTSDAIQSAVHQFESLTFSSDHCRMQAEKFSNQRFQEEILNFVEEAWLGFKNAEWTDISR